MCVRQDIDITTERIDEVFFINIGVLEREQLEYVGFQYAQHQHGKQWAHMSSSKVTSFDSHTISTQGR